MNLLDGGSNVDDDHGHGSLVTAIVHECTHGPFEVFKVTDAARKATEWEVLQALSVGPMPPIVNLSMSLSFGRASCSQCGRQPVGARTSVFEERLRELAEDGVIVVVAAGNQSAERLAYPSRFSSAVAVQAWSGAPPRLAPYSNSGAADQAGARHPNVFLCPGGRREANEGPGLDGQGKPVDGTSFAAAYMSGLLAVHWAAVSRCTQACEICRAVVLERAQLAASPRFPGYDASRHGHGLARLP